MQTTSNCHQNRVAAVDPIVLTQELGGTWHSSYGVAPCPVCQIERRNDQNALTISADGQTLLLHCKKAGCDFRGILVAAGIKRGTVELSQEAMRAQNRERVDRVAKAKTRARKIWNYGADITGTKGEAYLRGRGITCPLPPSLRFLPDAYHAPSGSYCSAMIADVAPTGGIHRTFFTKKGVRLQKSAKMMLGPCAGGAVRLSETSGQLVVCEGIETGLSLLSGILDGPHTLWAALSAIGMKALILPPKPSDLVIATDGDEAGISAGNSLAQKAYALGWAVSILAAPAGQDWNDVLQSRGQ